VAARFDGRSRQTATLALLAFAMLIVSLDQYIVVVALPEIGHDLGYSVQTLQSVISAYAVVSAGFLLLGGRAADRAANASRDPMPTRVDRASARPRWIRAVRWSMHDVVMVSVPFRTSTARRREERRKRR
jgi:MFS family permease